MEHNERREGYSAGRAGGYFEGDLGLLEVGASQGEDHMRGAYDWWPLTINGRPVAELRHDANGMTIHTQMIA